MSEGLAPFEQKPCARLDFRGARSYKDRGARVERMVVATEFIDRGRVIIDQTLWMIQVSFVATSEEEVVAHGEKLEWDPNQVNVLRAGQLVDPSFISMSCPAHLQMTCELIRQYPAQAQRYVQERTLSHGAAGMNITR